MSRKRAVIKLRESPVYRKASVESGLRQLDYRIYHDMNFDPSPDDVLVIWNRTRLFSPDAERMERHGGRVIVMENGYLGNDWQGHKWLSMALGHHAGLGKWHVGGNNRWDDLSVEFSPWVEDCQSALILGQRGIGEPNIASPERWAEHAQKRFGGRIRPHPGKNQNSKPLADDLSGIGRVITWASSSALKSLILGVPVYYEMPGWIGAGCSRHVSEINEPPIKDDEIRLNMFRSLVWAMWKKEEIESGVAFETLLQRHPGIHG